MKNYTITVNGKVYQVTVEEGTTARQLRLLPEIRAALRLQPPYPERLSVWMLRSEPL